MNEYNGYLYCIGHPCMVNIYKIGFTRRTVEERLMEANTGDTYKLPGYEIVYKKKVRNVAQKETLVKNILDKHAERIHPKREFYRADFLFIKSLFDLIDGKVENVNTTINIEDNNEIIKKIEHYGEVVDNKMVKEKKFKCEKCDVTFFYKSQYDIHLKTKKHNDIKIDPHKCEKCEYNTINLLALKVHILNNHSSKEKRKKDFNFYCEKCDVGKMDKKEFDKHLNTNKHKLKE